jgi:hypothetical protein
MSSVPLVALQYTPETAMEGYAKMQALQQKLREGELDAQTKQLEIQKERMGLQQIATMNEAYSNALSPSAPNAAPRAATPQNTGAGPSPSAPTASAASPSATANSAPTFDRQKVFSYLANRGQGALIPGLQKTFTDLDKTAGDVQELRDKHTEAAADYFGGLGVAIRGANYSPEAVGIGLAHAAANGYAPEAEQIRQELAQNPSQLKPFIDAVIARSPKQAEAAKNLAQAGRDTAESGKITAEMPGGPLYSPSDNQLYSLATNPATAATPQGQLAQGILNKKQQERTQLTGTEAAARISAENSPAAIAGAVNKKKALDAATGMNEQVYATDRSGRTMLMTKGDAVNQGFGYSKVGTHQITEDRQLNNRLADVTQKIAQYEQSFQTPLASNGWFHSSDATLIAQVIGTDKFKAGVFGTELPVDWMNKLGRSSLYANMSPQAQQRVIAYFNAREAIQGYQRVLTGSGRSSEKAMELNLDTLPAPIDPESYAGNALKAFKQNLAVAGQGMPILPGVKTPEEIEQQVNTR